MKRLQLNQMENLEGGGLDIGTTAGVACGLAVSGALFGGFSMFLKMAIAGPTCVGLVIRELQ
ncbi:hypothetical protein SAMN05444396_104342 [Flavobacterium segetis]|uniref:Uncharacterized protein n=1 Tax=Flavobacterium segetis TaxID=271157 RepID=A0A1M5H3I4_9FLAO|nr:hypothetical protein [Flavobacterium segetis]SHG10466.1 hypothetical protein SAMN05444396_104342 [Flavobacterium segetis]